MNNSINIWVLIWFDKIKSKTYKSYFLINVGDYKYNILDEYTDEELQHEKTNLKSDLKRPCHYRL